MCAALLRKPRRCWTLVLRETLTRFFLFGLSSQENSIGSCLCWKSILPNCAAPLLFMCQRIARRVFFCILVSQSLIGSAPLCVNAFKNKHYKALYSSIQLPSGLISIISPRLWYPEQPTRIYQLTTVKRYLSIGWPVSSKGWM